MTKNKNKVQATVVETTVEIAGAIQAYAHDQGDDKLKEKVRFTKGELQNLRDTIIRDISIIVLKEAQKIGGGLTGYGVTTGEVTDFETLIKDYRVIISAPRVKITDRATATKDVAKHLDEMIAILKERIDKLMPNFKKDHTHFFEKYFIARKVVDV